MSVIVTEKVMFSIKTNGYHTKMCDKNKKVKCDYKGGLLYLHICWVPNCH